MTAENFIKTLIETALPAYAKNITEGNGKSLMDFLQSESVEKPSAFISYEGWGETDAYSDGSQTFDDENYSIFLRTDGNVKVEGRMLKNALLAVKSKFTDDENNVRFVQFLSGKTFRDFGADAFEIMVIIK